VIGDATILVEEHSLYPCDCDCCYNLEVVLEDVPPGPWNLRYRWFDIEIWEWTDRNLQIEVPYVGQPYDLIVVADQMVHGCLEATGLPNPPDPSAEPSSWGRIKARYR
jgi:hypothetical protein